MDSATEKEETTEAEEIPNNAMSMDPGVLTMLANTWKAEAYRLKSELSTLRDAQADLAHDELELLITDNTIQKGTVDSLTATVEDLTRRLAISDSRRKMLELELDDRATWQANQKRKEMELKQERDQFKAARHQVELEEARKRMKQLQEEAEQSRKVNEERQRKEQQEREERAAVEQARAEAERQRREERRREEERQKEKRRQKEWAEATLRESQRCLRRNMSEWGVGSQWFITKSLSRVKTLVAEMEKLKFSESQPFTSHVVPWPVLGDPALFVASELEWSSIDTFFERVQLQFDSVGYKEFVHRVHLMFHPDRWKSKGYLVTVQDEEERGVLERAGNVVSQAVTPLWRKTRS